jgi:Fic family protein
MTVQWKPLALTPAMVRLIGSIDEFKGRWQTLCALPPGQLALIRRDSVLAAAAAASRLEGRPVKQEELTSLMAQPTSRGVDLRAEAMATAYGRTLDTVHALHEELPPTRHNVVELHRLLCVGTDMENPSPTPEVLDQLDALLLELQGDLAEPSHHPLISIPLFNLRLLSLHPFPTGNGRLARILTTLLMLRAGYGSAACASLEVAIETHRVRVHRALRRAQTTGALNDWMLTSLQCLADQRTSAERHLEAAHRREPLPPLSEALIRVAATGEGLSIKRAVETTGANRNTVKVHVRRLVQTGRLVQHGRGRATWYVLPERSTDGTIRAA